MTPYTVALATLWMATVAHGQHLKTEVLWPGEPLVAFDLACDQARLERELSVWRLETAYDSERGEVLQWTFTMRQALGFNDVFLRREVEPPFEKLSIRVRNVGASLDLAVKIADVNHAEYRAGRMKLAGGGGWQEVEWGFDEFRVASWSKDPDGRFNWPVRYL
ncbi:MAG: hypothetical protein ACUVX8_11895 [Candidatus Zipacnadales bacterium]